MKVSADLHLRDERSIGFLPPSRLRVSTRGFVTALTSQLSGAWGRPEWVTPSRRQVGGHITRWPSLASACQYSTRSRLEREGTDDGFA